MDAIEEFKMYAAKWLPTLDFQEPGRKICEELTAARARIAELEARERDLVATIDDLVAKADTALNYEKANGFLAAAANAEFAAEALDALAKSAYKQARALVSASAGEEDV